MEGIDNESCAWYQSSAKTIQLISYDVLMPLLVILGLSGHTVCLIAFHKQSKKESAYMYQIFSSISQANETIAYAIHVATYYWFPGSEAHAGVSWYMRSYVCMWITAHVTGALVNASVTLTVLLGLAMASDRVFALGKPLAYKKINHTKHQVTAAIICVLLAVTSSVFDCLRFYPIFNENEIYTLAVDEDFMSSFGATFLSHLGTTIRGVAAVGLVAINIAMFVVYRRFTRRISQMTRTSQAETKRREQQKVLALLAFFESLFTLCEMTIYIAYYLLLTEDRGFYPCKGTFYTALMDDLYEVFGVCDFFVVFAISKRFREIVFESAPCLKRFSAGV